MLHRTLLALAVVIIVAVLPSSGPAAPMGMVAAVGRRFALINCVGNNVAFCGTAIGPPRVRASVRIDRNGLLSDGFERRVSTDDAALSSRPSDMTTSALSVADQQTRVNVGHWMQDAHAAADPAADPAAAILVLGRPQPNVYSGVPRAHTLLHRSLVRRIMYDFSTHAPAIPAVARWGTMNGPWYVWDGQTNPGRVERWQIMLGAGCDGFVNRRTPVSQRCIAVVFANGGGDD